MAKTKTYKYVLDFDAVVTVGGDGLNTINTAESREVKTDDPAVQAALDANPDFSEVKGGKKK